MSESHVGIKAGHPYLTYDAGEVIIHQLSRNGRWALLTTPFRFSMRSKKRASSGLPEIMMRIPSRSIGYGTNILSNWRAAQFNVKSSRIFQNVNISVQALGRL